MSDILKKLESGASDDVVNKSKLKMDRIKIHQCMRMAWETCLMTST